MPRPRAPKLVRTAPDAAFVEKRTRNAIEDRAKASSPASSSSGRLTTGTDDSDGLVVSKKSATTTRRKHLADVTNYTMSGALAVEETGTARLKPPSKKIVEDMTRIVREADHETRLQERGRSRGDENVPPTGFEGVPSSIPATEAQSTKFPRHSQRPNMPGSRRPSLTSRGQRTPLAQSSSFGTTMFKKRPRQPSLLRMMDSQIAQSRLEDHTALSDDAEEFDDFRPDDESTPLVKSLIHSTIPHTSSSSQQSSGSRKRKLLPPEVQVPVSQSPPGTNLALGESSQTTSQQNELDPEPELDEGGPEPKLPSHVSRSPTSQIYSDTMAPPESCSSSPTREAHYQPKKKARPPSKSKTQRDSPIQKQTRPRLSRAVTSHSSRETAQSKPLTTATLQNLLPRRRTQHLAPKSTYDFPTSSDIDAESVRSDTENIDEDEDELSFNPSSRGKRKISRKALNTSKVPKKQQQQQSTSKPSTSSKASKPNARSSTNTPKSAQKQTENKCISRTYSRKSDVVNDADDDPDAENDNSANSIYQDIDDQDEDNDDEDDTAEGIHKDNEDTAGLFEGKAKKEMARLAKKFREVDEYTLDFEDMTGASGSSQMRDAR